LLLALIEWANTTEHRGEIEVVLPKNSLLTPEIQQLSVKVTETEHLETSFNRRAINTLLSIIKAKQPDIVHTHAALSGRIAAKLYGKCRIVYTRHCVYDVSPNKKRLPSWIINNILADKIIAVSPAVEDNLKALGCPAYKIHMIHNGVQRVPVFQLNERTLIRQKYNLKPEHFIVSIMARLVKEKNHDTLLSAAKIISDQDKSVKFLIAGEGPLETYLKARAQNEDIENVFFLGFVKDTAVIENITDLQVNASIGTEAASLALLEGLSLGVPAVVSDFGGNPYVIEDGVNGLVFPRMSSQALAQSILRIRKDPELYNAMSFQALETYETRFTVESMSKQVFKLYSDLCERGSYAR
jgi:glycosyltransferase involved in cell wall biosynthesis